MNSLLILSLLIIIAVLFPGGIFFSLLAKKYSRSERGLWSYCKVLLIVALSVALCAYLFSLGSFRLPGFYRSITVFVVFFLGLLMFFIVWFFQKGWHQYEKLATILWGFLVFFIVIILSLNFSIFYPVVIKDDGMDPVYVKGSFVFCQTNIALARNYSKGDTVIFQNPIEKNKTIIRKIIATSGDSVKINGGQLFVNDQLIRKVQTNELIAPVTLADGQYFVLAESDKNIFDSKTFGPISGADIYAKIMFKLNWLAK
ncbi:MAG: signal peptidase I [Candidatus Moranbacteria bacterium]|nr:signal peptidase I [Candidatus Moranbacteria bacterium]